MCEKCSINTGKKKINIKSSLVVFDLHKTYKLKFEFFMPDLILYIYIKTLN